MGDLGINATTSIIEDLKEKVKEQNIKEPSQCKQLLIDSIKAQMDVGETAYEFENRRSVVLVIGVNGVGKTTSIGKLAGKLTDQGKKVVLAAADTFRAAAENSFPSGRSGPAWRWWAARKGPIPASVVYDAIAAAKARHADVLLCDTAGRLHNKKNLMAELERLTGSLTGSIRKPTGRRWWSWTGPRARTPCSGKTVRGGGQHHRHYPDEAGRHGKGRHRGGHSQGTGDSGEIHRRRREYR